MIGKSPQLQKVCRVYSYLRSENQPSGSHMLCILHIQTREAAYDLRMSPQEATWLCIYTIVYILINISSIYCTSRQEKLLANHIVWSMLPRKNACRHDSGSFNPWMSILQAMERVVLIIRVASDSVFAWLYSTPCSHNLFENPAFPMMSCATVFALSLQH